MARFIAGGTRVNKELQIHMMEGANPKLLNMGTLLFKKWINQIQIVATFLILLKEEKFMDRSTANMLYVLHA